MKKFFILASAAIVALASCAKTEVVYKDAPEEIAFKAVTGVMSKVPHEGTNMPTADDMVVYASASLTESGTYEPYFSNVTFDFGTYWTGNPSQYWPKSGYMKFLAYYPNNIGTASGNAVDGVSIVINDIATTQTDILYSDLTSAQNCETKPVVPMTFHHALAQIVVKASVYNAAMNNVVISSVAITTPNTSGEFSFGSTGLNWETKTASAVNMLMDNDLVATPLTTSPATLGDGSLVVPGNQTSLVISYKVGSLIKEVTKSLSGTSWDAGQKYIYNIVVTLDEIKLSASVENWTDASTEAVQIM
jgi:hypothetical protein